MSALSDLAVPQSATLDLETLTPLYTGGIGQQGEALHPSGILGGLRRFSCLLASALGDGGFETRLWGSKPDAPAPERHGKRVALGLDPRDLKPVTMPAKVNWPREDGKDRPGWYFNRAQVGRLRLVLTHRRPSDPRHLERADTDWQWLLLALRIQLRHATLGARDQWGMGILHPATLPAVPGLSGVHGGPLDRPGLHRAFFARLEFDCTAPVGGAGAPDWHARMEAGLRWRAHLRGALRKPGLDDLRHYLFGKLNQWGSAVNVSALYPVGEDRSAVRVWGVIPHTVPAHHAAERADALARLYAAMEAGLADTTVAKRPQRIVWEDGATQDADLAAWINRLAGVA